ncbi:DUF1579 family protein [Pyruvatibacter sp.]|uniref:DUF1579 family protein n=1 Tax=Pyruvatibacter sp. TaxID=1981328 RepID=UPI0032EF538E
MKNEKSLVLIAAGCLALAGCASNKNAETAEAPDETMDTMETADAVESAERTTDNPWITDADDYSGGEWTSEADESGYVEAADDYREPAPVEMMPEPAPETKVAESKPVEKPKASEKPKATPEPAMAKGDMSMEEMMAAYMEASTPGEHHEHLSHFVGSWTYTSKFWEYPGAEPGLSTGTASVRPDLGGRYFVERVEGSFMDMPFEGRNMMGYDKVAKEYFFAWGDSMSTGIMVGRGQCDGDGKVFTYHATYNDPMAGPQKVKSVVTVVNNNMHIYESFAQDEKGQWWKNMELTYKRRN